MRSDWSKTQGLSLIYYVGSFKLSASLDKTSKRYLWDYHCLCTWVSKVFNQSLSTMMLFWGNPGDSKPTTAYHWLISMYKFSRLIFIHFLVWENVIKDQSIFCLVIINSHNHIFWQCVDIMRRKLILVITQGHPMSIFGKLR